MLPRIIAVLSILCVLVGGSLVFFSNWLRIGWLLLLGGDVVFFAILYDKIRTSVIVAQPEDGRRD
jgi:hypothetical protein